MPQAFIYFDNIEDAILRKLAKKWNISKHEVVKRIVREFKEMKGGEDAVI